MRYQENDADYRCCSCPTLIQTCTLTQKVGIFSRNDRLVIGNHRSVQSSFGRASSICVRGLYTCLWASIYPRTHVYVRNHDAICIIFHKPPACIHLKRTNTHVILYIRVQAFERA